MTLAGYQIPTKVALSLSSATASGRENIVEGSRVVIRTEMTHQISSQTKQTAPGDSNKLIINKEQNNGKYKISFKNVFPPLLPPSWALPPHLQQCRETGNADLDDHSQFIPCCSCCCSDRRVLPLLQHRVPPTGDSSHKHLTCGSIPEQLL